MEVIEMRRDRDFLNVGTETMQHLRRASGHRHRDRDASPSDRSLLHQTDLNRGGALPEWRIVRLSTFIRFRRVLSPLRRPITSRNRALSAER